MRDDFKLPGADDLEYPSLGFETSEKPRSKLIPLDQLSPVVEEDSDTTDPAFELPQGLNENYYFNFRRMKIQTSFGRQMISRKK